MTDPNPEPAPPARARGGPRPGSGRKPSPLKSTHYSIRTPYALTAAIRQYKLDRGLPSDHAAIVGALKEFFGFDQVNEDSASAQAP